MINCMLGVGDVEDVACTVVDDMEVGGDGVMEMWKEDRVSELMAGTSLL